MYQQNTPEETTSSEPQPKKSPFSGLIPKGDYFFTPIIININILVFLAMVLSGASFTFPDELTMVRWGANVPTNIINGEYWRLLTSMFLHYGILHIFFNMTALMSIGRILEPFIGRFRFLVFYLLTGIVAGVTSVWWHSSSYSVGAGASGAILGIVGVLSALLTTNLIVKEVRFSLLKSLGISIGLTMLIGLSSSIDNSAHAGGFLSGMICGYLSYFDLKSWYQRRIKKNIGFIAACLVTIGIIAFLWMRIPYTPFISLEDAIKADRLETRFVNEEKAITEFSNKNITSATPEQIKKNIVDRRKTCLLITDSLMALQLSPEYKHRNEELQLYAEIRLEAAQAFYRSLTEKREDLKDSTQTLNSEADSVLQVVNALTKAQKK